MVMANISDMTIVTPELLESEFNLDFSKLYTFTLNVFLVAYL